MCGVVGIGRLNETWEVVFGDKLEIINSVFCLLSKQFVSSRDEKKISGTNEFV